jgi:hypothetical protein
MIALMLRFTPQQLAQAQHAQQEAQQQADTGALPTVPYSRVR